MLSSTEHPQVPDWTRDRARLIVINRVDMITEQERAAWQEHFAKKGETVFWTDGKSGQGIVRLKKAATELGK